MSKMHKITKSVPKIVISHAEVKAAQKASGRRNMTAHRYRKLLKQLKQQRFWFPTT